MTSPETTKLTAAEAQRKVDQAREYLNYILTQAAPGSLRITGGDTNADIFNDEDVFGFDEVSWTSPQARDQYNRLHSVQSSTTEPTRATSLLGGGGSSGGDSIDPQDLAVTGTAALQSLQQAIKIRDSLGGAASVSSGGGSAVDAYMASEPNVNKTLKQQYNDFIDRATDITRLREEEQQFDTKAADATRDSFKGFQSGVTSSAFTPVFFGLPPSSGSQFQRFSAGAADFPMPSYGGGGGAGFSAPSPASSGEPGYLPGLEQAGLLRFQRGTEPASVDIPPELASLMGKGSINMTVGPPVPPGIPGGV